MPVKPFELQKAMIAAYVWLRITLSYCVVGAVLATLISAYIQVTHLPSISLIMIVFLCFGMYKTDNTRRSIGLNNYFVELSNQKDKNI